MTKRLVALLSTLLFAMSLNAAERPNIVVVFADDISARELPIYGSSVWSPPLRGENSDPEYRASTPVLDRLAQEGCWIRKAWASVVCSPSRAMMMTGRYAHRHKWWGNKSKGNYVDENGKEVTWPLYLSSPLQIGHVAQQAGYGTYWAGKTQMAGDLRRFGFDQGCFTPGNLADKDNPFTDFKHDLRKVDGEKLLFNADTDELVDTYQQHGWYFFPHVRLMNHGGKDLQWWPNTPESAESFGPATYGPDVELDFVFDFMEKQVASDKPFFVYHTTHLGHDAFDWLDPDSESSWPGTPVIRWDGDKYIRTTPKITGEAGNYDTHGTVTLPGIHHHINYLDYQAWLYQSKLEELGIADNTIFVFCADNGTGGYGKNSPDRQKGTHVPLIISAPDLTKRGEQDVLVNMSDILPTIAELTGVDLPADYEINGDSLVPFLFGDKPTHREWLYGYLDDKQIIRGTRVMRDGRGKWWNVEDTPSDLISFPQITDWSTVSDGHRAERDRLESVLLQFDQQRHGKNASDNAPKSSPAPESPQTWTLTFKDDFEDRTEIGDRYKTSRGHEDGWSVADGVLIGKQTKEDHGAVIRTEIDFDDVDIQFDFRFNGGKSFNFVIDDANEKSVHAGHICRASIFPKYLRIGDDKTGSMNLEVRKQRQARNLPAEDAEALQALLKRTQSSAKIAIEPGKWHTLRIRIRGDVMKAFLDDELVTSLRSLGFDHPTKTKFGFTVNGATVDFDNLSVRQLSAMEQADASAVSLPAGDPPTLKDIDHLAGAGPFRPSWESLEKYQIPEWYKDGKLGIFIHWGAYSVPAFGSEWYPRQMYIDAERKGENFFEYHRKTYGPQNEFGYKDFIPMFKAEKFNPQEWVKLFQEAGARYIVPVAEHHDGFPMYACSYTKWDATEMGPRRDVIAELAKATRDAGLKFGVSSHRAFNWAYYVRRPDFDNADPRYESLYGRAIPELFKPDAADYKNNWPPFDDRFRDEWLTRTAELVDRYNPDLVWFDFGIAPKREEPFDKQPMVDHLRRFAAYYYNHAARRQGDAIINYKWNAFPDKAAILDLERSKMDKIRKPFWQTDTAVSSSSWGYTRNQKYKSPDRLVDDLVDIVSKNGCLLLNVGPRADGTIPEEDQRILRAIGGWLKINGEAIYGTRPWKTFGEGPTAVATGHLSEKKNKAFTAKDIRFTTDGETLYVIPLAWPEHGKVTITSLAEGSKLYPNKIDSVALLGSSKKVEWTRDENGLSVKLPSAPPSPFAYVLKISR